jgi:Fe2+ transport system protein FeoA
VSDVKGRPRSAKPLAAPFNGPLTVRSRGGEHAISRELAATIGVE